jgi:hypothetical protein
LVSGAPTENSSRRTASAPAVSGPRRKKNSVTCHECSNLSKDTVPVYLFKKKRKLRPKIVLGPCCRARYGISCYYAARINYIGTGRIQLLTGIKKED